MATDKTIKPKMANQKRPINPDAKLSGYKQIGYLQLHANVLAFPTRPVLIETLGDKEYVTAVTGNVATKPFGTTTFAKVEVIKDSIKLGVEGDFAKNSTNVKSTVTVMFYADKESTGFAAKLKGADVHIILPKYTGEMVWLGDKDVPAKVVKYSKKDEAEASEITLTIEFDPYEPLFLEDGSIIDTIADA